MLSKRILLIILFIGCVFFLLLIPCFIFEGPIPKPISPGLPLRLKIPKINVDAPIDFVGVTPDGAVDVPKDLANVAWFNLGPRPGDIGSAVITGHYGSRKNGGGSAVFGGLNKLISGDKIYVEDEEGMIIIFVVRELRTYGQHEYAPGVFDSGDGKAHLNLITCEGDWIASQKTYSSRFVIFADKI